MRLALSILAFQVSVYSTAIGAPNLARVFCGELAFRQQNGFDVVDSDEAWKDFAFRLEQRVVRMDVTGKPVQECLSAYREEMERGEFILDGKRMLERMVTASPETEGSSKDPSLASILLPGFGEVIMSAPTRRPQSPDTQRVLRRSEHYDRLWKSFLDDLRKAMTARIHPNRIVSGAP